jgi:hypothetical protein
MANHNEYIPAIQRAAANMPLRFSFKYLDLNHPKFSATRCGIDYFVSLFQLLHRFSNWVVEDFIDQNNNEHRHMIDFAQTTERDGFRQIRAIDPDQFGYDEGWELGVCPDDPGNQWRAHGILVDDTFFVVWLDQDHLLYP